MPSEAEIEAAARKLAGQYMIEDGYPEDRREIYERGTWQNFKAAAGLALEAAARVRASEQADIDPWDYFHWPLIHREACFRLEEARTHKHNGKDALEYWCAWCAHANAIASLRAQNDDDRTKPAPTRLALEPNLPSDPIRDGAIT